MTTTTRPGRATYTPAPSADDQPLFDEAAQPAAQPAQRPASPAKIANMAIDCIVDGFPVCVRFDATIEQIPAAIKRLREIGAVPATVAAVQSAQAEAERSAPYCEYHGAMAPSTKEPGGFYCKGKMGDGTYCKSAVGTDGKLRGAAKV
jgi:hypothetical protein